MKISEIRQLAKNLVGEDANDDLQAEIRAKHETFIEEEIQRTVDRVEQFHAPIPAVREQIVRLAMRACTVGIREGERTAKQDFRISGGWRCEVCDGNGWCEPYPYPTCPVCNGTGRRG